MNNGTMPINFEAIPAELQTVCQWVAWRYEDRKGKPTKIPINPTTGHEAKSNTRETWGTFDSARQAIELHNCDGIGFVFSPEDDYFGVDLDACRNPETGELTPWASEIVGTLNSYTEVSPSQFGVKIVARGKKPEDSRCIKKPKGVQTFGDKAPEIAIYDCERFWTFTGNRLVGAQLCCEPRQEQLDSLLAKLFPPKYAINGHAHANGKAAGNWFDKLLADCGSVANGERSERDFALCAAAYRRGFSADEIWNRVSGIGKFAESGRQYFDRTWQRVSEEAANDPVPRRPGGGDAVVRNAITVGGGEDLEIFPIPLAEIIQKTTEQTGGLPYRVAETLFAPNGYRVDWLHNVDDLFAWLHLTVGAVDWKAGKECATKKEMRAALLQKVKRFEAVEEFPHFPPRPDHFYIHPEVKLGDGSHLLHLIDRFCPSTPIDRDLITTLFATPFWGGDPGTRPAFQVTAPLGRGMGKTALVEMVGRLVGGMFDLAPDEKAEAFKKRLLTPAAATKRIVLCDNIKTSRFSWGELEALITCWLVSGHRMYCGEGTRPNTFTWAITMNGAALSKDLAQRCVTIKLGKPNYSGTWKEETASYIERHRWEIIGDIAAFFQQPAAELKTVSRWAAWESGVLARTAEPADSIQVILERQSECNVDDEEASTVEDYFAQQLERIGYYPENEWIHIPNDIACQWYRAATQSNAGPTMVTRVIKQWSEEQSLKCLRANPCRTNGRGLLWGRGLQTAVAYDVDERIRQYSATVSGWR
jgi:hypothetical protein